MQRREVASQGHILSSNGEHTNENFLRNEDDDSAYLRVINGKVYQQLLNPPFSPPRSSLLSFFLLLRRLTLTRRL
jgi:hypothetical protein